MSPARRVIIGLGIAVAVMPLGIAILAMVVIAIVPDDGRSSLSMVEHLSAISQKDSETN